MEEYLFWEVNNILVIQSRQEPMHNYEFWGEQKFHRYAKKKRDIEQQL
jgi:hypothetical protein